jgi:hypothetical protein
MLLLPTTYKILSSNLVSRLIAYVDEIIEYYQWVFRRNRQTTDQIFCIRQILEKRWSIMGQCISHFLDFKKAYVSGRREVLYNILIEFGVPVILGKLGKICSMHFFLRMVWRKVRLYHQRFSSLFYNMPPIKSNKIRKEWNWMEQINLYCILCWWC